MVSLSQRSDIRFWFRGELVSITGISPQKTVLKWLREDRGAVGTKEGCGEGDCGACTVAVGTLDPTAPQGLRVRAVNSCLLFLPALDGKALFTVEDVASGPDLHPVQRALVDLHASQCGFCTPGFVMSLWADYQDRTAAPTRNETLATLSGNLCRCTGYRPIIDAAQAAWNYPPVKLNRAPVAAALATVDALPPLHYEHQGRHWSSPRTLDDLAAEAEAHPDLRLIGGATDLALRVTKGLQDLGDLLYTGAVDDLKTIETGDTLVIGASVGLNDAFQALKDRYPELSEFADRFASRPVRNAGTLGGNVANGSPIGDSMPVLLALGASVTLRQGVRERTIPLDEFYLGYQKTARLPGEVLKAIRIPPLEPRTRLRVWKVSKRRDQDISAVCGAFAVTFGPDDVVVGARLGFGGMAAVPARARKTEAALIGHRFDPETLAAARQSLAEEFQPLTDGRATSDYRRQAAANLLTKLFHGAGPQKPEEALPPGNQVPSRPKADTLGASLPHEAAPLHVTGAAPYVDDLPEWKGSLHGAFVLAPVAHGRLKNLDLEAARSAPGVVAILTAKDIPGRNNGGPSEIDDPVLAGDLILFHGQALALVLAETFDQARRAAKLVKAEVDPLPAHLTVDEARAAESWVLPPMNLERGHPEEALASAPHRLQGTTRLGGQEHFYLEGQVALAVPKENFGMHIHSSTQHPTEMQHLAAELLGWEAHQVSVECRRMGGGFGGKESQSGQVACAAALGAWKTGRPVKVRLDRDDDMSMTGKRHDFLIEYDVGFDDHGAILGVKFVLASRCGYSPDLSGPVNDRAIFHVDNAYYLDAVAVQSLRCRTNTVSNTAFRGFGGPQGIFAIETALDDIARTLGLDPLDVRKVNFYGPSDGSVRNTTPYGMKVEDNIAPGLVDRLETTSDYRRRRQQIETFNAQHQDVKRGIALVPVKFGISFTATFYNQAGALVHVYADGSVLVTHGGTEMGQGLYTKIRQIVAFELGVPVGNVRLLPTDTSRVPNTSATAASSGTDLNGMAALLACREIKKRLDAFAATQEPNLPWDELVGRAYKARIKLWDSGFYATPKIHYDAKTMQGRPFFYFAYGACCAEVEVDTLTGENRVLRADILHDTGRSLNPAIDRGQVEGGFVQGTGWLTTEELWWTPDGRLWTHAPSTYKIPAVSDVPADLRVDFWEEENREESVHRSKAVGEPPLIHGMAVYFALRHAVGGGLGAPATPEALLRALGQR